MKKNSKDIISKLVQENKKIHYNSLIAPVSKFVIFSIIYTCLASILYFDFRVDINNKILNGKFILELFSCFIIFLFLGKVVYENLRPKNKPANVKIILTLILFLLVIFLSFEQITSHSNISSMHFKEMHCMLDISLFTIPISAVGFYIFKRNLTTHPGLLGSLILAFASMIGYLVVRMSCATETHAHQTFLHLLPILFYIVVGFYLGKKIFKW